MEKYKSIVKMEQIKEYLQNGKNEEALEVATSVDLTKVKDRYNYMVLAKVFLNNGLLSKAKDCYTKVYEKSPSRHIVMELANLSLRLKSLVEAERYIDEFKQMSPDSFMNHIFKYKVDRIKGKPIEDLVVSLEKLKNDEFFDNWGYELAKLYNKLGQTEKCIAACNDVIIWFGSGDYVEKARALRDSLTKDPIEKLFCERKLIPSSDNFDAKAVIENIKLSAAGKEIVKTYSSLEDAGQEEKKTLRNDNSSDQKNSKFNKGTKEKSKNKDEKNKAKSFQENGVANTDLYDMSDADDISENSAAVQLGTSPEKTESEIVGAGRTGEATAAADMTGKEETLGATGATSETYITNAAEIDGIGAAKTSVISVDTKVSAVTGTTLAGTAISASTSQSVDSSNSKKGKRKKKKEKRRLERMANMAATSAGTVNNGDTAIAAVEETDFAEVPTFAEVSTNSQEINAKVNDEIKVSLENSGDTENVGAENVTTENATTENEVEENAVFENVVIENADAEIIAIENIATGAIDSVVTENVALGNITTENIVAENVASENITVGVAAAENVASEENSYTEIPTLSEPENKYSSKKNKKNKRKLERLMKKHGAKLEVSGYEESHKSGHMEVESANMVETAENESATESIELEAFDNSAFISFEFEAEELPIEELQPMEEFPVSDEMPAADGFPVTGEVSEPDEMPVADGFSVAGEVSEPDEMPAADGSSVTGEVSVSELTEEDTTSEVNTSETDDEEAQDPYDIDLVVEEISSKFSSFDLGDLGVISMTDADAANIGVVEVNADDFGQTRVDLPLVDEMAKTRVDLKIPEENNEADMPVTGDKLQSESDETFVDIQKTKSNGALASTQESKTNAEALANTQASESKDKAFEASKNQQVDQQAELDEDEALIMRLLEEETKNLAFAVKKTEAKVEAPVGYAAGKSRVLDVNKIKAQDYISKDNEIVLEKETDAKVCENETGITVQNHNEIKANEGTETTKTDVNTAQIDKESIIDEGTVNHSIISKSALDTDIKISSESLTKPKEADTAPLKEASLNSSGMLERFLEKENKKFEEYFGFFAYQQYVSEQLVEMLDVMLSDKKYISFTLSCEKGSGKKAIINGVTKLLADAGQLASNKPVWADAMNVNETDMTRKIAKLEGRSLAIDKAGHLEKKAVDILVKMIKEHNIAVILVDYGKDIAALLKEYPELDEAILNRMNTPKFVLEDLETFVSYKVRTNGLEIADEAYELIKTRIKAISIAYPEGCLAKTEKFMAQIIDSAENRNAKAYLQNAMSGEMRFDTGMILKEDIPSA